VEISLFLCPERTQGIGVCEGAHDAVNIGCVCSVSGTTVSFALSHLITVSVPRIPIILVASMWNSERRLPSVVPHPVGVDEWNTRCALTLHLYQHL